MSTDNSFQATSSPNRRPAPGPRGQTKIDNLIAFRATPLQFLMQAQRDYGDIVRLQVGSQTVHLVSRPAWIRYVLANQNQYTGRSDLQQWLKPVLGNGLQRKIVGPSLHWERIGKFSARMTESTAALLDRWQIAATTERSFDIAPDIARLTKLIFQQIMFGIEVIDSSSSVGSVLKSAMENSARRMRDLVPQTKHCRGQVTLHVNEAIQELDSGIYRLIDERRAHPSPEDDLLSILIEARDPETGSRMNDQQVRDAVMTLFMAGYQTTADALTWTLYLLSMEPDVDHRLAAELTDVLAGRRPTLADLPNLTYTRRIIQEATRLYPPSWAIVRVARHDDEIGGYHIPAESTVVISQYVMHRHPQYWEAPDKFAPDRFVSRPPSAYFPFGVGPRSCIGTHFATLETTLVLAMVAQHYRLCPVPGHIVEPEALITLRPRNGVLVTLQARERV